MTAAQAGSCFRFLIVWLTIEAIHYIECNQEISSTNTSPYYVSSLPEKFSNDKLLNPQNESNRCFDHLGCVEMMPINFEPQEPIKLGTTMHIFTRANMNSKPDIIDYNPTKACLRASPNECSIYPYNLEALENSSFRPEARTVFVLPGFRSHTFTSWQEEIRNKWLQLEDVNLILLGWEGGNHGQYVYAVANVRLVARQITVFLYYLYNLHGIQLTDLEAKIFERLQFVGHSLGAHMAGLVGHDLGGLVGRITGLDPAGPEFYRIDDRFRLDRSDAKLVDVLHTNGCEVSLSSPCYGLEKPVGHLDFYANDGKIQPQCRLYSALGCSHTASIDFYNSFLEHEIYTRRYLGSKYHLGSRLFAIKANNFEDFYLGTSLSRFCPRSSLSEENLEFRDINGCTVPIDFVSPVWELRQELVDRFNLNLASHSKQTNSFYFYTSIAFPYVNNQNIIKIRVSKTASDNYSGGEKICDFILVIKMANGAKLRTEVEKYNLIEQEDHYEIIAPFISANSASKHELAKLNANNFYLDEPDSSKLRASIVDAFPQSIEVIGLMVKNSTDGTGIFDAIKGFFQLASQDLDRNGSHMCRLNVEAIRVQPLKRTSRHFVAAYSLVARGNKSQPDLIVLKKNEPMPKVNLLHNKSPGLPAPTTESGPNSEIFIDTVIIGPQEACAEQH